MDTAAGRVLPPVTSARPEVDAPAPPPPASDRRRRSLALDLTLLGVVGVLLLGAAAAAIGAIHQQFYSPTAFVQRYLAMLADGRAAEALTVPGVAVDSADLEAAGLPASASEALLREAALGSLEDARVISEQAEGDLTRVTVEYEAGG